MIKKGAREKENNKFNNGTKWTWEKKGVTSKKTERKKNRKKRRESIHLQRHLKWKNKGQEYNYLVKVKRLKSREKERDKRIR